MTVQTIPPIEEMTPAHRADLMEELWKEMSKGRGEVEPPEWHRTVLEERERALANGETDLIPWEEAKAFIREKTINRPK